MTLLTVATTTRLHAEQTPGWQRFQTKLSSSVASSAQQISSNTVQQHPYQRQYAHVYHQRLAMLGPTVWKRIYSCDTVNDTLGSIIHTPRILELPEDTLCSCVGTLIVERDSIPQPTEDDNVDLVATTTSTSDNCNYYLEDESGRVALNFATWWSNHGQTPTTSDAVDVDIHALGSSVQNDTPIDLCTGLVIGLVGIVGVDGVMQVQKVYSAATVQTSTSAIRPSISTSNRNNSNSPFLLLLSGLDCGSPNASSMSRDMLISYLQGAFPHRDSKAASIVHVVIAGGLICSSDAGSSATLDESTMITANGCCDLDIFCYQITQSTGIPASILPGQNDPTTANWPQRPLHSSLIPVSTNSCHTNNTLVSRCPNPYAATFTLDKVAGQPKRYVFGTDGTNVADWMVQSNRNRSPTIKHCGDGIDEMSALHASLAHQHICPTGPDTVPTAPHVEIDPMVMTMYTDSSNDTTAHPTLYFAGNCTQFQTKLVTVNVPNNSTNNGTTTVQEHDTTPNYCRLVCIPKFSETCIAVLVNLETLQVETLKFDTTE